MGPAGCQWSPETPKTSVFPRQDGGKREGRLGRSTSQGVSNPLLKHKKPQYSLGKTDLRRYPVCPEGLFSQFSLTHPFKHSNEAFKATFGAQKTHVFIGSVLTRSFTHAIIQSLDHSFMPSLSFLSLASLSSSPAVS